VGCRRYQWLTPEVIDQIWVQLRAGQAAKPTARELGLSTGTVRAHLVRCSGIRRRGSEPPGPAFSGPPPSHPQAAARQGAAQALEWP
jgi:hypothetical protein